MTSSDVRLAVRRRLVVVAVFCLSGSAAVIWWGSSPETVVALVVLIQAAGAAVIARQVAYLLPAGTAADPDAAALARLAAAIEAAKGGDLTVRAQLREGPLAPLGGELDEMLEQLSELVGRLGAAAAEVSISAESIERLSRVLAERASRQSAAIAEVARKLKGMGARSEEIGQIVELLEDVAAETNVLALNAALEASRAGAQGKGFGMVADEVRKLAERSAAATKDIGAFIQGIEATTDDTTRSVEEIRGLTEGLVVSASQTAFAAGTLLSSARVVSQTLLRLRVPGQDESDLARALRERRGEIARALEPIAPLLEGSRSPLGDALKQVLVVLAEGAPRPTGARAAVLPAENPGRPAAGTG